MHRAGAIALLSLLLATASIAGCIGDEGSEVDLANLQQGQGLSLDVTPKSGDADTEFTFDASDTPGADSLTFTWDFGDGATANGTTVKHVFAYTNNLYEVEVTAHQGNRSITDTIEVPVGSGRNAQPAVTPTASAPWVGHGDELIVNATTSDPDGDPVEVTWLMAKNQAADDGHDHDHGGGGGGTYGIPEATGQTGEQATFTFEESGTYRLYAQAEDPKGGSAQQYVQVKVTQTVPKTTYTFEQSNELAAGTAGAGISNELYTILQPSQNTYVDAARYDIRLIYPGAGTFSLDWSNTTAPADLDLFLYDQQGEQVQALDEVDPTATSVGTDVDLPAGSYTIVVAANAGAQIPYTVALDLDLKIPGLTVSEDGHDHAH